MMRCLQFHGIDELVAQEAIAEPSYAHSSGQQEFVNPEFRDALMGVAGRGGLLNVRALGNCSRQGVAVWALKKRGETNWFDGFDGFVSRKPGARQVGGRLPALAVQKAIAKPLHANPDKAARSFARAVASLRPTWNSI